MPPSLSSVPPNPRFRSQSESLSGPRTSKESGAPGSPTRSRFSDWLRGLSRRANSIPPTAETTRAILAESKVVSELSQEGLDALRLTAEDQRARIGRLQARLEKEDEELRQLLISLGAIQKQSLRPAPPVKPSVFPLPVDGALDARKRPSIAPPEMEVRVKTHIEQLSREVIDQEILIRSLIAQIEERDEKLHALEQALRRH